MPCINHPDVLTGLATCTRCAREFCGDCVITLKGAVVCAGCKGEVIQDVKSGMVAGELDLASRGSRFLAVFIDQFIIFAIVMLISVLFGVVIAMSTGPHAGRAGGASPEGLGGATLVLILVMMALPTVYEAVLLAKRGQTLGKMAMKIKVVNDDNSPISTGQAWGRAAGRSLMGLTGILGLIDILMIFSGPKTTLHDRMAKTRVVNWKR